MRLLIFIVWILFISGCKDDADIPKDIIARDKMGKILWDMIRADQFSIQYMVKDSARNNVKTETMKLYEEIFHIHHISREEFQKSFQFYIAHPNITKVMFDSLSAQTSRQRIELFKKPSKINNPATKLKIK